jgi:hypothetical protein
MDTLAEIREKVIQSLDEALDAYKMAEKVELTPEQLKAIEALKAAGMTVEQPKVNQVAVDKSIAAFDRMSHLLADVRLKGTGTKTPQPIEDQTFFNNELKGENYGLTTEGAFKLMREKLEGVDGYELVSYDPNYMVGGKKTGNVTVKVQSLGIEDAHGHIIHAGKEVTFARNNPGTLADAIKLHRHVNPRGKAIAAKIASAIVVAS